jgi:Txe/YoeB family toxin of toxin-antitoxin system
MVDNKNIIKEEIKMKVANSNDVRKNLKKYLDQSREDHEPIIITTANKEDIIRTPFQGIGKPEPLKNNLKGLWSRKLDIEHRIVYIVEDNKIVILQCRYHYD